MRILPLFLVVLIVVFCVWAQGQDMEVDPDQELLESSNHNAADTTASGTDHANEFAADHDHELLQSVSRGELERAIEILNADPDSIHVTNTMGWNALIYATANGHVDLVHELLGFGADVNEAEHDGWTPLMFAAFQGREDIAHALVEAGADLLHRNAAELTAHELALSQAHDELASYLGEHSVMQAIGHFEAVDDLIFHVKLGVSPNIRNDQGWSGLCLAAANGRYDAAEELINLGAVVDLEENDGWTPLLFAANNGHPDIAKLFLNNGAKIDHVSHNGATALSLARDRGFSDVVEMLEEHIASHKLAESAHAAPEIPVTETSDSDEEKPKKKGFFGIFN